MTPDSTSTKKKRQSYLYTVGRRKTATARVRFMKSTQHPAGTVLVNEKVHTDWCASDLSPIVVSPIDLIAAPLDGYFSIKVTGGGRRSQAEACRHGITRMLIKMNEEWKTALKSKGYVTRDPRAKERKKPGLKRARRSPQWSKR
ncbi:MAG: 30S ribosomal protein S9 [Candidatus Kerfeldbacteria bacterium]|nr:30S ribosomal protein S9 [Candidatus Kerfeldbacteria bacterium]